MSQLEDLLQQCTVKLTVPHSNGWGTGFFVAPGWILTCAHVVRKAVDSQVTISSPVWQQPLSALVKATADDGKTLDLALIELTELLPDHPCMLLDEEPVEIGQKLYSYGYLESYLNAAPVRPINEGLTGDKPPLLKLQGAQIERGISGAALLNLKTGKVCGMLKETRAPGFDLGGGAIPTSVIFEQFPQLRSLQQEFHERDRRWCDLLKPTSEIDLQPYLQSIVDNKDYRDLDEVYTATTVVGRKQEPHKFSPRLKLRVETIKLPKDEREPDLDSGSARNEEQEQVEQFDVLAGLREYAVKHVLLIGKPGSGKSTSLARLLWEDAAKALQDPSAKIPVLIKLRHFNLTIERSTIERPTIKHLIKDFFDLHRLSLQIDEVEDLLKNDKLLLLLDGLNELPEAFEAEIENFRNRYRTTPMIFSTRDLSVSVTLGITKTLRMMPLTKQQMQEFAQNYLHEDGDRLFRQLEGDRLRKFAETPLLLWMLCEVFKRNSKIPKNLGLVFREFTQDYDQNLQNAPVKFKDQWSRILSFLAFKLMSVQDPKRSFHSASREEIEDWLTVYLNDKQWSSQPRIFAIQFIMNLLNYQLLQSVKNSNHEEHIEFRHQLFQEYYAAEYLQKNVEKISELDFVRNYLNKRRWTETMVLMLDLLSNREQALKIVKLAKNVDFILGAELGGSVKLEWQEEALNWIDKVQVPPLFRLRCWEVSESPKAALRLVEEIKHPKFDVRSRAAEIIGKLGIKHHETTRALVKALRDKEPFVCRKAADALIQIGDESSIYEVRNLLSHKSASTRYYAALILGRLQVKEATEELMIALDDIESRVRSCAAESLGDLGEKKLFLNY